MRRLVTAALAVALLAVPVSAHLRAYHDPDDAPGRDLRRVEAYRSDERRRMNVAVDLWDGLRSYEWYLIEFDTRGDEAMDYFVSLQYDGGSSGLLGGVLQRADGSSTGAEIRMTGCEYSCWFPISFRSWRLRPTKQIGWRVSVDQLYYGSRPGSDSAPDVGWYRD